MSAASSFEISFFIENDVLEFFPIENELKALSLKILEEEKAREELKLQGEINVIMTDDSHQRQLNREFRNKDKTTDVLSFPWYDEDLLGEIYISEPQVRRQAPRFNNSFEQELKRMFVHGILHLCGYDHMETKERQIMRNREENILGWKIY